ncbi:MAG: phosphoribosylanthranilate isomerase [Lentisphaerae bacterium]|nr:MAG: phosphoribosylanthranilate isomerase [Lentisphaerota bacterium]
MRKKNLSIQDQQNGAVMPELIKICGLTREEDACAAFRAGADLFGMIFYPRSRRYLPPEKACQLVRSCSKEMQWCGVFVNEPVPHILQIAGDVGLWAVQLHGDEDVDEARALREAGLKVIKALPIDQHLEDRVRIFRDACDFLLVDTPCESYGGSGQTGDWDLVVDISKRVPLILAGGLAPENVADAINRVRPTGVDVSSGVERAPGIKEIDKINVFIKNARAAWSVSHAKA